MSAAAPSYAETPADVLVIAGNTDDAITVDPHAFFETSNLIVVRNLYQQLFATDPGDPSKPVGDIAESWSLGEDGKTLRVKIKSGLTFASGNPITAEDVVFSLQRAVKIQKTPSFVLAGLGWTPDTVDGLVKLAEDGEVLLSPDRELAASYITSVLTTSVSAVVDKQEVLANEKDGDLGNGWLTDHSAGSGPYVLRTWKPREAFVLEASPNGSAGPSALKQVILRHVADPSGQQLLLSKGDVDVALNLTTDQLPALETSADTAVSYEPNATVFYAGMSMANPDLAKPKVQEAFRYLIDYDGIASTILKGQVAVQQGLIAKELPAGLTDAPYAYDPEKARALLAEAGYPDGLDVNFDLSTLSPYTEIGQAMVESFAKAGVRLNVRSGDMKQVVTAYRARQVDFIIFSFVPDFADPQASADFFLVNDDNSDQSAKKGVAWRLTWQNDYSAAVQAALVETDAAKRVAMYEDLQKKVRASSPIVSAFQKVEVVGYRKDVANFKKPSIMEAVRLDEVVKKR